jgi:hypothetical protein
MTIKRIDQVDQYKDLREKKTIFGIVDDALKNSNRESINNYFTWLKAKNSTQSNSIDNLLGDENDQNSNNHQITKITSNPNGADRENSLNQLLSNIFEDGSLVGSIKESTAIKTRIDNLFNQTNQNQNTNARDLGFYNIATSWREQVIEKISHTPPKYGVDDITFLINVLYEEAFFKIIPKQLKDHFDSMEISANELSRLVSNEEWKERCGELFFEISDKLDNIDQEKDLHRVEAIIDRYTLGLVRLIESGSPRKKISELPTDLYEKIVGKGQITESSNTSQLSPNYPERILPNIGLPWQDNQATQPTNISINLPIRLINVPEGKVEGIMPSPSSANTIRNYAILSHSWGSKEGKYDEANVTLESVKTDDTWHNLYNRFRGRIGENTNTGGTLYPRSYKSLLKSARALQAINEGVTNPINHLWMDQLCIDQRSGKDNVELDREMLKFRRYYANATLSLVSINAKLEEALNTAGRSMTPSRDSLGTGVVSWLNDPNNINNNEPFTQAFLNNALDILSITMRSEWRFSSWTYKEGWLSKQTIFMFDDVLVDGRFLAMVWAKLSGKNSTSLPTNLSFNNFSEFRQRFRGKYATPIGWAYQEEKQPGENLVTIRLNVALAALIGRRRHETLDSLRSVLAVLPYGHLVEIEKWRKWASEHSEGGDDKLFQRALCDVMKIGAMNGYGEFLTWFGLGNLKENSWLPTIEDGRIFDTNMVPRHCDVYCAPGANLDDGTVVSFTTAMAEGGDSEKKVTIRGFRKHDITNIGTFVSLTGTPRMNFFRLNQNNEVEADVLSGRNDVSVNVNGVEKSIRLVGTKEALGNSLTNGGEIGRIANIGMNRLKLLVPHNDLWKSIRIDSDGTESTVPIALLVEKRGNDSNPRYRRIDLVKLLDTNSQANSALNQGSISQHTAQIEVWPNR